MQEGLGVLCMSICFISVGWDMDKNKLKKHVSYSIGKRSPTPGLYPSGTQAQIETKNPRVNLLVSKWQQVWLLALERRRKLNDALDRLEEVSKYQIYYILFIVLFNPEFPDKNDFNKRLFFAE